MALSNPKNVNSLSYRMRQKRDVALRAFLLRNGRRVLDIGGSGDYWRRVGLDFLRDNGFEITIINLLESQLGDGPFRMLVGDATALDIEDNAFDIAHSNSVIEHVGGPAKMAAYASEMRRVAPAYYMQTPNYAFPIDPHFWKMPFFHWYPEAVRRRMLQALPLATAGRMHGAAKAQAAVDSVRLIGTSRVRELFPDATLQYEKLAGLNKSIIATREG